MTTRTDFQRTDVTITRIRGELFVDAPNDTNVVAGELDMGLIVVTNQAFAAGAGSLPDPALENADWLWWKHVRYISGFYEDNAGAQRIFNATRYFEVDSKAQRKLDEENKTLVWVVKNQGGSTLRTGLGVRTLLKR